MLFRYSFPMPQENGIFPVIRYVHSDFTPSLDQMISLFKFLIQKCEDSLERCPRDLVVQNGLKENKACLFALKHVVPIDAEDELEPHMPEIGLSSAVKTRIVMCDLSESNTGFSSAAIKYHLVDVSEVEQDAVVFAGNI